MVSDYIGELAKTQHVVPHIQFWTRVESAVKPQGSAQWHVRTKTFIRDGDSFVFDIRENRFDAVVVATGHYDVPRVPDIPGLATWQARFPGRVAHSKAYRTPDMFKDATVLVIGAGVSAYDIIHAIHSVGGRTYQSSRDPKRADKAKLEGLPDSCERVPGIETFLAEDTGPAWKADSADPVPGRVVLSGGRELTGIHYVVVATGYITTYHFLGDLEQPTLPLDEADEKVIITADAYTVHNLHKDIFYIPDPTLAFIGVPSEASTFSLFDFQAKALAKVFTGQAQLPSREDMAKLHRERKLALKPGKKLHGLGLGDVEYANDILDWINGDLQSAGLPPMTGYDDRWFEGFKRLRESVASIRPDVEQV
ncbi:putative dimethylaniline monooxygenase protein [Phaeoacremonium minimum UCRPA7]|uniref:Putative dimethylaniline monooxygenase protein n=1 Tax=Phaeoacremonium minimum (strain UCR-PA7) TaxID=1286976 RepID=R8BV71_PHAM7|nr:putative dimethylaniline monooxygenase protein [Phaeoacremonium minimum UCRPA7]EOO03271.1 putative dimethylaniline monooxygenase protein [Phaeoacremonium minimum UCRPA7]